MPHVYAVSFTHPLFSPFLHFTLRRFAHTSNYSAITPYSSLILHLILQLKFQYKLLFLFTFLSNYYYDSSHSSPHSHPNSFLSLSRYFVKIYVFSPNCFWTTRHCTGTLTRSCSTCCAPRMTEGTIRWDSSVKKSKYVCVCVCVCVDLSVC